VLFRCGVSLAPHPEGLGMPLGFLWPGSAPRPAEYQRLNHDIGLATSEPDEIPELRFMRPGMLAMAALGLALAAMGRRRSLIVWSGLLLLSAVVGMADFYKWEYDYGHNLDMENAPLKIPGMSYQPPLIGSKKLLNFTATSLPALGGVLAIASVVLATAAIPLSRAASPSPGRAA
jgi:copper chaperone NosL